MQCETSGCRLDPRLGRPRHSNPRCDPGPPWWELPEWAEWLRTAARETRLLPPESAADARDPASAGKET